MYYSSYCTYIIDKVSGLVSGFCVGIDRDLAPLDFFLNPLPPSCPTPSHWIIYVNQCCFEIAKKL
jgi:hypothetical protein